MEDRGRITRESGCRNSETLKKRKVTKGTGPGFGWRQRTRAEINPLETNGGSAERCERGQRQEGRKPVTATDPSEGKPLKAVPNPKDVTG